MLANGLPKDACRRSHVFAGRLAECFSLERRSWRTASPLPLDARSVAL